MRRIEPPLTRAGPRPPGARPEPRRRGGWRIAARMLPAALTLAVTGWALSTNPLAAPFVERGEAELRLTLERMVRRTADAAWIEAALRDAVAAGDADRAAMLLGLAGDLDRPVPEALAARADELVAARDGWGAFAEDCAACVADPAACPSTTALATCALPFELSPLGDANALRRAGTAWAVGEPVDRLDAGLAAVGLGATVAVAATAGGAAPVKLGAGLMRAARRMGSLSPSVSRLAMRAVDEPAARTALMAVAADMGRVRGAVGTAEALRLARLVDGPGDAARLARVAEAAGANAPRTVAVLGKARVMRATVRLTRMAAGTLALIWLSVWQVGVWIAARLGGAAWRAALR